MVSKLKCQLNHIGIKRLWASYVHCLTPAELFQILKDEAVKVLHLIWQEIGVQSRRDVPGHDKVTGWERNLKGSSSPQGCPRGPIYPFPLSVLLLLGFLLIFGNVIYSDKPRPLPRKSPGLFRNAHVCSGSGHDHKHQVKKEGHGHSLAACLKDYNVLE